MPIVGSVVPIGHILEINQQPPVRWTSGMNHAVMSAGSTLPGRRVARGDFNADDYLRRALILWLLGVVSSYTMGGFIHLLLILAIAVILIRVIQGRRPV